jgi:hypothetical protein
MAGFIVLLESMADFVILMTGFITSMASFMVLMAGFMVSMASFIISVVGIIVLMAGIILSMASIIWVRWTSDSHSTLATVPICSSNNFMVAHVTFSLQKLTELMG